MTEEQAEKIIKELRNISDKLEALINANKWSYCPEDQSTRTNDSWDFPLNPKRGVIIEGLS